MRESRTSFLEDVTAKMRPEGEVRLRPTKRKDKDWILAASRLKNLEASRECGTLKTSKGFLRTIHCRLHDYNRIACGLLRSPMTVPGLPRFGDPNL